MEYRTIPPPYSLAAYVRFFWTLEAEVPIGGHYIHRAMADGCSEWLFHYKGTFREVLDQNKTEKSFTSGFQGQTSRFRRFVTHQSFGIFGVYLYPHALPALFQIPACEISNQMPDIRSLMGKNGDELESRIMMAKNNEQRVAVLSAYLQSRLQRAKSDPYSLEFAIKDVIRMKGQVSVNELANRHCLSKRHFERKFKELAGMSPKLYSRVVRFQSVFPELNQVGPSLTEIALQCGYYDQSHFIQDFKEFAGFSPGEFLRGNTSETVNWTG
ncbi:helix-turn-helix transcriptional regulator [uncultured Imperialibacter sp.]|uniref:helix-turn-helix domain-containing protein n=1 Tax=uncultured Imperialibacter sp. TaxID=1672639 RepID=UPI0030D7029D|tara:strand:- start:33829 stop:34638 length:810 start_codon:yes stop_codon:yes gene_type:complete